MRLSPPNERLDNHKPTITKLHDFSVRTKLYRQDFKPMGAKNKNIGFRLDKISLLEKLKQYFKIRVPP